MSELETAIALRENGKYIESNEMLIKLVQTNPDNPVMNYHCAWSFDILGQERAAIPFYEKAIQLGLNDEDLKGAYIGLGSTYRTIGEYEKSKDVFIRGMRDFPQDNAIKVFYAMTLYNLNEHSSSMEILLTLLADTSSDTNVNNYSKAIKFYSGNLSKVW